MNRKLAEISNFCQDDNNEWLQTLKGISHTVFRFITLQKLSYEFVHGNPELSSDFFASFMSYNCTGKPCHAFMKETLITFPLYLT